MRIRTLFLFAALAAAFSLQALTPSGPVKKLSNGTKIKLEGEYLKHIQGIATDGKHIYWSMSDRLVKSDLAGKVIKIVPITFHAGDPCWNSGKLYVPVSCSGFNRWLREKPSRNWVYIYDSNLKLISRRTLPMAEFGAGAIEFANGEFYLGCGRPKELSGIEVLVYDRKFRFRRRIPIEINTVCGIQTIKFDGKHWWLGCYGPNQTIVCDKNFRNARVLKVVTAFGSIPLGGNRILSIRSGRNKNKRYYAAGRVHAVQMSPRRKKKAAPKANKVQKKAAVKAAAKTVVNPASQTVKK